MGAGGLMPAKPSPEDRASSAKSRAIDRAISKEFQENQNKFKILLLGGSGCGKTTIFKQMRILHLDGFSKEDSLHYIPLVHNNAVDSISQLLEACQAYNFEHDIATKEDIIRFEGFKATIIDTEDVRIPLTIGRAMDRIWHSSTVQQAFLMRFDFRLLDSAKYFLDDLNRLTEDGYVPTTQDILKCRFRTTGITEITFSHKKMDFRMVDVGGQRNERGRWIKCFEGIDMILFVVALSDYDQLDPEDNKFNRLRQNHEIFKAVVQSDIFRHASIVLFLNKYDIFKEKLQTSPLSRCWKSYAGDNSEEDAREYVERQFEKCVKDRSRYYHFTTTATDTQNIEYVFGSAISHIVSENLRSTGLHE